MSYLPPLCPDNYITKAGGQAETVKEYKFYQDKQAYEQGVEAFAESLFISADTAATAASANSPAAAGISAKAATDFSSLRRICVHWKCCRC